MCHSKETRVRQVAEIVFNAAVRDGCSPEALKKVVTAARDRVQRFKTAATRRAFMDGLTVAGMAARTSSSISEVMIARPA